MNNMTKISKAKATKMANKIQEDFIAKGFKKLDKDKISLRPPKIKWGKQYGKFTSEKKIEYLEKLAATMNHAAWLIQNERNELLKKIDKKEEQLEKMKESMDMNIQMLHGEMEKINLERQKFNDASTKIKGNDIKEYLKKWQ